MNYKCNDPCPGSCGRNTQCAVRLHSPMCSCQEGYTGDPFTSCYLIPQAIEKLDPCNPTPCGANAQCKVSRNGAAACICEPGYFGNPYESCRPECVVNTDCPYNKACLRNKCEDPCPGVCGSTALCQVINHIPSCSCSPGYTGNPYSYCHIIINEPSKFLTLLSCQVGHIIYYRYYYKNCSKHITILQLRHLKILVRLIRAVATLFVRTTTVKQHVHVCQISLDLHRTADLSAQSTQNVTLPRVA